MADGSRGRTNTNGATQKQKAQQEKIAEMVRQKHDTDSGLTRAQREAVTRWEREHTNRATERVVAFDSNGKVMYESKTGSGSRTSIPLNANLKDAVITHNHPARKVRGNDDKHGWASGVGISLSGDDLYAVAHYNAKEIRAKASGYVYSLRRPEKGWPDKIPLQNAWIKAYDNARRRYTGGTTRNDLARYVYRGAKGHQDVANRIDRINATLSHMATREVAKKFGLKYTRSKA